MATVGQQVSYNEGANGSDSWVPAEVLITHDSWNADAATAMGEGNYPRQPDTDEVLLAFWSFQGNQVAVPASTYAVNGTAIGEYQ